MARTIERRTREAIQLAADEVPQRMAGKCVQSEQHDVDQQDQRAYANTEVELSVSAGEEEGANGVIPEDDKEDDCRIKKIAMDVLQNKRKSCLATIVAVRAFTDGASRGIEKEGAIVSLAVVIAGHAEAKRKNEDQQCRGEPDRQPVMLAVNQRRVEGRKVRVSPEEVSCKGAPRGIDAKAAKQDDDRN